jgi:lipoprotein signal peptidase
VADLAIVTGVIMLIVVMILEMTRKGSEKRENPEVDG